MKLLQRFFLILAMLAMVCVLAISCGDDKGPGPDPNPDPDPPDPILPTVTTSAVNTIMRDNAMSGGEVLTDSGYAVTARGVCWSTDSLPTLADYFSTDGDSLGSFTSSMTGLACSTTYYVRAYATSSEGTGYGNTVTFTTLDSVYSLTDYDGNVYRAVSIGTQVWMAENLRTTSYRNGEDVWYAYNAAMWEDLFVAGTGARCRYDDDIGNEAVYGSLYSGLAVTDTNGLAPDGWHIPTEAEWNTLIDYLEPYAGLKLKDTTLWSAWGLIGNNNESGFTALPGGKRNYLGEFSDLGERAVFWGADSTDCCAMELYWNTNYAAWYLDYWAHNGYSVRCVMD